MAHSKLVADGTSEELVLADGEGARLVVRMDADGEAMGGNPSSFAKATVFGVQEGGSPRLSASADGTTVDAGIAPTAFLEIVVDDPFAGCDGAVEGAPPATTRDDGGCVVALPVDVAVTGGAVSFQLDATVQLDFASDKAPGTLVITVAPES